MAYSFSVLSGAAACYLLCMLTRARYNDDAVVVSQAVFKVGGKVVGEHRGYMTPFEHVFDAATTEDCCCGSSCELEITLDGNRECDSGGCADALMGCMDLDIDSSGPGAWAGMNGQ